MTTFGEWMRLWWDNLATQPIDPDDERLRQTIERQQDELANILARMRAEIRAIPPRRRHEHDK